MTDRPVHLPPGTAVGDRYTIEGLVRLAEGRMFYLANDRRPDRPTRHCWSCGFDDTPRSAAVCAQCGDPLRERRFLVSARWEPTNFEAYTAYHALGIEHPGVAAPLDVFVLDDVLYSVTPYAGEGLMLDEASPLTNKRLLEVAQRLVGAVAALHRRGVELRCLTRANLLISPDHSVRVFDLEVVGMHEGEVPPERVSAVLMSLGELLRRYCDVEAEELADYLASVEAGAVDALLPVGRAVESRYPTWSVLRYAPKLGGMSDVGLTRQLNEDNWGWIKLSERASLYVVADGMGGHDGGEVASEMAVKTLCEKARALEAARPEGEEAIEELLRDAFQTANNTVKDAAEEKGTDMGTTLVAILVIDERLGFLANVGDSRGYLLREGRLHQLSIDHSLVQKMVDRGRITAEQARHHPHSNILLRTVGTEHDVEIDVFRVQLEAGDKVMMCSDGLWGEVEDRDIESILNTYGDPRIAARELVRAAHHGGGKDNVTLMIVGV